MLHLYSYKTGNTLLSIQAKSIVGYNNPVFMKIAVTGDLWGLPNVEESLWKSVHNTE